MAGSGFVDPLGAGPPPGGSGSATKPPNLLGYDRPGAITYFEGRDFGRGPRRPGGGVGLRAEMRVPWGQGGSGGGYDDVDPDELLASMPAEQIARAQRKMLSAGLLKEGGFREGLRDRATRSAFVELLELANMRETTWGAMLDSLGSSAAAADDLRRERARMTAAMDMQTQVHQYRASNPETLRNAANAAFQAALGRNAKDNELAAFTKTYLAAEREDQKRQFDLEDEAALGQRRRSVVGADVQAGGDGGLDAFMAAVAGQESGGNSRAVNSRTGAYGTFQIMPSNWPAWAKEAGLGANAERSAENQERVARFKMQQYKQQFGTWDAVAVAWYAGPGAAAEFMKNPSAARFQRKQGGGKEPSINEYVSKVRGRLRTVTGGAAGGPVADGAAGGSESDQLWSAVQRMIADAPGKITPGPRSRDLATQQRLYRKYLAGGPKAAKPGTSKHGDGRANDLKYSNDAVRQWALANAHKYGLAFPIYDPNKPRSHDESWHVELLDPQGSGLYDDMPPVSRYVSSTEPMSPVEAAAQYARTANPVEHSAYSIGSQFDNLLALLQRGAPV
jgi:hypothetical protein